LIALIGNDGLQYPHRLHCEVEPGLRATGCPTDQVAGVEAAGLASLLVLYDYLITVG